METLGPINFTVYIIIIIEGNLLSGVITQSASFYVWYSVLYCIIPCRQFVFQLRRISNDAGMPVIKDPYFYRYVSGLENVEPLFRQLKQERPELQLIMVILPGKTPVYGEGVEGAHMYVCGRGHMCVCVRQCSS